MITRISGRTARHQRAASSIRSCAIVLTVGAAIVGTSAFADDQVGLEEIIVTAQKHEQKLQDVPISMSALTSEDFDKKGMTGFREWADDLPGIKISQGASANRRAGPTAVIRGVSQSNAGQLSETSAQATTSYTFGQVPVNSGDPGLFDLNRIEVLRGPQGTLFGIASMGGTVRFIPNDARSDKMEGEIGVGDGFIDKGGQVRNVSFMANVPIIENELAVRIAGFDRHNDGFIAVHVLPLTDTNFSNIRVDQYRGFDPRPTGSGDPGVIKNANSSNETALRASVTYTPTNRLTIKSFAMTQRQTQATKQDIDYNDVSQQWVASRFALEPQENEFRIISLDTNYHFDFGDLNYIFGNQYRSQSESIDFTPLAPLLIQGAIPVLQANPALPADPIPGPTVFPFFSENRIVSNELRLQGQNRALGFSLLGSPLTFDYVIGLFDVSEKANGHWEIADPTWNASKGPNTLPILTAGGLMLGQEGGAIYTSDAVFGDLSVNFTPKFTIGGGVRFSHSKNHSDGLPTYGDVITGLASNGATVGSDLSGPGQVEAAGTQEANAVTPRVTASYRLDDDRLLYFTASKGQRLPQSFKNPQFFQNQLPQCEALAGRLGLLDAALNGTHSDTVWSYDLGLKSVWMDHRLLIDVALYDVRWTGMQLNVLLNQFDAACNAIIAANVGDVDIKGVEIETQYVPINDLIFTASVASADSGLTSDVAGVTSSLGTPLKKGDEVTSAPPWTANASAQYIFNVPFVQKALPGNSKGYALVTWRYTGERFDESLGNKAALRADPVRSFYIAPAYRITDARIGLTSSRWEESIYVSNLFNTRAVYASHQTSWLPNQQIVSVGQPRTIGVDFKVHF